MTEGVAIMGSGRPGAAQPRVSEVEMLSAVDRRSGTVRIPIPRQRSGSGAPCSAHSPFSETVAANHAYGKGRPHDRDCPHAR